MTQASAHEAAEEKVYNWEVMQIGHTCPPMTFAITRENIANYARSVQNNNPIYFDDAAARAAGFPGIIAPPTMCYVFAPMRRAEVMNYHGYVSPEQAQHNPRSTPFAGTEVVYQGVPVRPGDTITSTSTLDNRWETRTGNRFLSFRVVAHNQRGEKVVEYLYNIIWEYARGQKSRSA
ncbi:MAG: MaoC family dehydratase N-terminal domain-containing protein [Chloroflexi bacterium]|nr:MaoC family dehydratase N-terminal domain-containing protein [Chloroflexota bacterium]